MSKLTSGTYLIKSKAVDGYVGRAIREDMSLLPKAIVILPQSQETSVVIPFPSTFCVANPFLKWHLEVCGPNEAILKIRNAPTAALNGEVVALLQGEPPEEWRVTLDERRGEAYMWAKIILTSRNASLT